MPYARRTALLGLFCSVAACGSAIVSAAAEPALRRSDVVFMYDDPKQYEAYGCTVLGWAGSADPRRVEAAHAKGVRLFASSVGFLTEFSPRDRLQPRRLPRRRLPQLRGQAVCRPVAVGPQTQGPAGLVVVYQ